MELYLDNAATTKPLQEFTELAKEYMENGWYNPSSLYKPAAITHAAVNDARKAILQALHASQGELVFTSGGTEANNTAVASCTRRKGHIITSQIEHPSVYETIKKLSQEGCTVDFIKPGSDFTIDASDVASAVKSDTVLVSIMHVNNETGAVNDITAIAAAVKKANEKAVFHSDGVQAFMKIPVDLSHANIDLYTISAHKIHALKGTGALFAARKGLVKPLLTGGGQESGLRSGTENTLGIASFRAACMQFKENFESYAEKMHMLRQRMITGLSGMADTTINSAPDDKASPHILNVSFLGVRGEVLLHALEEEGIYIGIGAACSSKKGTGSRVLKAMGLENERLESAVRLSISPFTTELEIDTALQMIMEKIRILKKFKRR